MHSTSVCQPSAGLKAHDAEVALAQGVPGEMTPRAPGPVSHDNTMHLTLCAQPAAWHQSHGFWQFVTSLKRHHKIACDPSLAYFSQIQELRKVSLRAFHTTFHFSNLFLLCQSCCCFAHIFDGLSHLLYTYMHVCLHTYKPIPMN